MAFVFVKKGDCTDRIFLLKTDVTRYKFIRELRLLQKLGYQNHKNSSQFTLSFSHLN